MDDREKRIRDRAHFLWLDAGQPDGHEVEHWEKAIGEVDTESKTNIREELIRDVLAHGASSPAAATTTVSPGASKSRARREHA